MAKAVRILAFDISMSRPGAAIVEINAKGKAKVVSVSNCRTNGEEEYVDRAKHIEAWAYLFMRDNLRKGFDVVLRESYAGRFNNHPIFTAWSAVDRAQSDLGLADTVKPIAQQTVKKHVVGRGRAEKSEVEAAVRKHTGYKGEFACDDESDAVAIALCYAMQAGLLQNELIEGGKK